MPSIIRHVPHSLFWSWIAHENLDPELDAICPLCPRKEWTHANSCVVLGNGDLLTCFRSLNNVCIIDRRNGEIKWEWGSGLGQLAHPHDPHPLPNGNIMIFDNGAHRALTEVNCSIVVEVDRQKKKIVWEYRSNPAHLFYSSVCSGAQRLPNGNTLICETTTGRIFEVSPKHDIVWEFNSPFFHQSPVYGRNNYIARAYRYGPDYAGLKGNIKFREEDEPQVKGVDNSKTEQAVRKRIDSLGY